MDISSTQCKRVAKIIRLREYFGCMDSPQIDEWNPATDEQLNFELMTDAEVTAYLEKQTVRLAL